MNIQYIYFVLTRIISHGYLLAGEVGERLPRKAAVPLEEVGIVHTQGHVPQLPAPAHAVGAHAHLGELLHAPLFAALVLEPDLEQTELFLKRTKSYLK